MPNSKPFDDKTVLLDALDSEKQAAARCNAAASECATPALQQEFLSLLAAEHKILADIAAELKKRGWYSASSAEPSQIEAAKRKFSEFSA